MSVFTKKQVESLSDCKLDALIELCNRVKNDRQHQKQLSEQQIYRDLYDGEWLKLKFSRDELDKQYILVHIDKVQNVYNSGSSNRMYNTIIASYTEQYYLATFDKSDVYVRHIVANTDKNSVNTLEFDTDDVLEFVKLDKVEQTVDEVLNMIKVSSI